MGEVKFVQVVKGVGWNRGMEGRIFPVMSEEDFKKVTEGISYPKAMYPIYDSVDNEGTRGVKVLKPKFAKVFEEETLMELANSGKISQEEAVKAYEVAIKMAQAANIRVNDVLEMVKSLVQVYQPVSDVFDEMIDEAVNEVALRPEIREYKTARQRVVERAKKFIENLRTIGQNGNHSWEYRQFRNKNTFYYEGAGSAYNARYIVNRKKRTVVCLLTQYNRPERILVRGKAKAHPNDCFNEHIGKAIALAKALKVEIPVEFLNAPEPEGFEKGDFVKYHNDENIYEIVSKYSEETFDVENIDPEDDAKYFFPKCGKPVKVVDDSPRY